MALVCPTGLGIGVGFFSVLVCPTGLEGFQFFFEPGGFRFFKYWFAQRVRGVRFSQRVWGGSHDSGRNSLFLHGFALLLLLHVLVVRVLMLLMSCCHVVVAVRESQTANCLMAQVPLDCRMLPCKHFWRKKTWLILPVVICLSHGLDSSDKAACKKKETWLILPVIICLSYGLSCSKNKVSLGAWLAEPVGFPRTPKRA